MEINPCIEGLAGLESITIYSHVVPIALNLFLGGYALFKAKFSRLSVVFFLFTLFSSIWLAGDLVAWGVIPNYFFIYTVWSWLDYVNIVFFALGTYFFAILARGRISLVEKILIVAISVPAFVMTITGNSLIEFYQPWCEALENGTITTYKLFAEGIFVALIVCSLIVAWTKSEKAKKVQLFVVAAAVLMFFAVFSSTEYIATVTNVYEINLYGLFVLPVFLIIMVFAITNLGVFRIRFLGTQLLVYALIIMVGSQLLFLESSTDALLNILTLLVSIFLGLVLLQNTKKELEARIKVEKLAGELKIANSRLLELDKQKTEFVSFASHQLRGPLTAIKGYASLILDGDYGAVADELKKAVQIIFDSTKTLATVVDDYLNVTRIELGQMKYEFSTIDFGAMVKEVVEELKPNIEKAGLKLEMNVQSGANLNVKADKGKLIQVVSNIIDNSVKYTPTGKIMLDLQNKNGVLRLTIKDTGIGISKDVIPKLFSKFKRADNANQTNMRGTGLGLFIAKEIITAHNGKIWVESEGEGKGSMFVIEIKGV